EATGFDLRGFGRSGGPRATIDRWSQLHDDVEERVVALRSAAPARPLVLYGHSLGALVVLGYVLDGRARPDLLVLSAPAVRARIGILQRLTVGGLGRFAPDLRIPNGIDPDMLTCDPAVGSAYVGDPLCVHRSTLRFARAGFAEQQRVARGIDRLGIETLVIHGGQDRLVPLEASRVLEGRPGVTRIVYPAMRHEIHNESDGPRVVADIVGWVRERVSRMPPNHALVEAGAELRYDSGN
ncbi:MAG TPA: alpha/beta fold hydrolase, partial [Candidatus Deferrimicrobiaceae bacterium]|nr:alpha/beta fold hydrolase [Candidatus Deferrimicrobiaceae bacterium]